MLIACDVDAVCLDIYSVWWARYNAEYSDDLTSDRVLGWYVHKYVKPECGKKVYDYLAQSDLYDAMPAVKGALWGVGRLREMGHEVLFASSCYVGMADPKAKCLERHGFFAAPDGRRIIETGLLPDDFAVLTDKTKLRADLLIEDAGHIVKAWVENTRRRAILLNYPHNADLDMTSAFWSWCRRAHDWTEIVAHVEAM